MRADAIIRAAAPADETISEPKVNLDSDRARLNRRSLEVIDGSEQGRKCVNILVGPFVRHVFGKDADRPSVVGDVGIQIKSGVTSQRKGLIPFPQLCMRERRVFAKPGAGRL